MQASTLIGSLALAVLVAACSGGQSATSTAPKPSADVITREQIVAGTYHTALDAIEALHHNWLVVRATPGGTGLQSGATTSSGTNSPSVQSAAGPTLPSGIQVYLDGVRIGGPEQLRRIEATSVFSIRHYSASEAQTRFGVGHNNGAIAISTSADKP